MIEEAKGNLLEADAEALVNTVNTVGYMGKGIALQFKQALSRELPGLRPGGEARARSSRAACSSFEPASSRTRASSSTFRPSGTGAGDLAHRGHRRRPRRRSSRRSGASASARWRFRRSAAGTAASTGAKCGRGSSRRWRELPDVPVLLFEPRGAPAANEMPIGTKRPAMTVARAVFVKLMEQYSTLAYRLTLLEIQKLAYFLQEAGEPLRLRYEAGHFGPYAANLNKVLERIEGHFVRGYGDSQKPDAEIGLLEGAAEEADAFLDVGAGVAWPAGTRR